MSYLMISVCVVAWAASGAASLLWWVCRCSGTITVGDMCWGLVGAAMGPITPLIIVMCRALDRLANRAPSFFDRQLFSCKRPTP